MGAAAGGTLALAVLVCACVFAAMAGPAISLRLRTEALQQALNRFGPLGTAIEVDASWNTFTGALAGQSILAETDLSTATFAFADGFATSVPIGADFWGGLTTSLHTVIAGGPRLPPGYTPELEVTYREKLPGHIQVIAGRVAGAAIPRGVLGVAVTRQTAARYGLHLGSRLKLNAPGGPVTLLVTAVVRARNPASTFWATDPLASAPDLTEDLTTGRISVLGAVLADPGQLAAVQTAFCPQAAGSCDNMTLEWEFPVAVGQVNADQAQAFSNALAVAVASPYQSEVAPAELTITDPMAATLTSFITAQTAVLAVLLLLFASMAAMLVVVITLAARIVVARRDGELITLRHRGASSRQVATRTLSRHRPRRRPGRRGRRSPGRRDRPRHQHHRGLEAGRRRAGGRAGRTAADRGLAVPESRARDQPRAHPDPRDADPADLGGRPAPPHSGTDGLRGRGRGPARPA